MVHKCSEYRLQFRQLTSSIRAEIWKENANFREIQRRHNMSDHYWRYQLIDEDCVCDGVFGSNAFPKETHGLPSPSSLETISHDVHENSGCTDQAVQTPDWTLSNENCSASRIDEDEIVVHSEPTSPVKDAPAGNVPKRQSDLLPAATVADSHPITHAVSETVDGKHVNKNLMLSSKLKSHHKKTDCWKKDESAISHLNPSPTRDTLKSYKKEKKPVFVAFGWNENDRDVGSKRTHNILAPQDQVNPLALHALRNRQKELEKYFAYQRGWNRHQQSLVSIAPIDLNIWRTEYQEKFCGEPKDYIYNPNKIESHRKPVVWRHS